MNTTHTAPLAASGRAHAEQQVASDLLTREQAAAYLGIAKQTLAIWKCHKRHDLPYVQIGRLIRYKRSELDAFIRKHSAGQSSAI